MNWLVRKSDDSKDKEDLFETRTNRHIDLVKKYCQKIHDYNPERFDGITELGESHDQSKFAEPERTPYIKLTWNKKFDVKPDGKEKDEITEATEYHVSHNTHHPEYWSDKKQGLINKENRDHPPKEMVDATKMTDLAIAEMVADWAAMSEELGENTPREWAERNVGVRWKFTEEQKGLIYELIDAIWD